MDNSIYIKLNSQLLYNGNKINLNNFVNRENLIEVFQYQRKISCQLDNSNGHLSIVNIRDLFCERGLTVVKKTNVDYFVGLTNPLLQSMVVNLGIAEGMTIQRG